MAKSQDAKKNIKKEPLKTAKEKKAEKREKKAKKYQLKKRDWLNQNFDIMFGEIKIILDLINS